MPNEKKKVLMLCTGGTITMLHKEDGNLLSPLEPAKWEKIGENFPAFKSLPFHVDTSDMEPIDSSDMNPQFWLRIAKEISDHYSNYDGFVVLHGTDTMTYTATALSFFS